MEYKPFLADRLNTEPLIFRGCSSSELGVICLGAILFWFPVGLITAGLAGAAMMGLGMAALSVIATIVIVASLFQHLKRGRPDGYYQQLIITRLHDRSLYRSRLIRHTGVWDLGRRL